MNATQRGVLIFIGIMAAAIIFCGVIPFMIFGGAGHVVALPVIEVPGEVLVYNGFPFGFDMGTGLNLTNTWVGTLLADLVVLLFAFLAWRASKGWTNKIPGRFQSWVEMLFGALYGFTKDMAGSANKVRTQLFPLVATIFVFLLAANWIELLPGVDSVGIMHCAHGSQSGYPRIGERLYNTQPLFAGTQVSTEEEHACDEALHSEGLEDAQISRIETNAERIDEVALILSSGEIELEAEAAEGEEVAAEDEHAEEAHGEEAATTRAITEEERAAYAEEYAVLTGYEHPIYFLTAEELVGGVQPYSFVVTPFVRAAATDLNVGLGLAIVAFFAFQYFGVSALGLDYFQKFINFRALGNLGKNPIGAIDFVVGLFEIISEFAKLVSLAFRLFGNIFAGAVLLFVMSFLVATFLPVIFFGLETIVGFAQALVFAVLTLIFSAQAMVSHHHEDHDDEHEHAEAH